MTRNAKKLKKLMSNLLDDDDKPQSHHYKKFDAEVLAMRRGLRDMNYLNGGHDPFNPRSLVSIEGEELDSELIDFIYSARDNYETTKNSCGSPVNIMDVK